MHSSLIAGLCQPTHFVSSLPCQEVELLLAIRGGLSHSLQVPSYYHIPSIPTTSFLSKESPFFRSGTSINYPYHSWEMASSAVILWSWSTSIRRVTSSLAAETRSRRKELSALSATGLGTARKYGMVAGGGTQTPQHPSPKELEMEKRRIQRQERNHFLPTQG